MRTAVVWLALLACKGKEREPSSVLPAVAVDDGTGARRDVLPERGPDPDYPTPVGAGTDKIFLLEDPDRGPVVDVAFALRGDLGKPSEHVVCEATIVGPVCGPAASGARWTVWRKGTQVVAQERRRGGAVKQTYVWLAGADGALVKRIELDATGRVVEEARFVAGAKRYSARLRTGENALDGCGALAYETDDKGRLSERRCLQWSGDPMHDTDGVAVEKMVRDERGFVVELTRFGVDGAPIAANDGVHRLRYTRDASGRDTGRTYLGVDGKPVQASNGCYGWASVYDAAGELARTMCLDAAGAPMPDAEGTTTTVATHDARGCQTSARAMSADGKPVEDEVGVHGRDYDNDRLCRTTSETCIDVAGKPTACGPGQPARITYTRDADGRVLTTRHADETGAPTGDAIYGVVELRSRWDERDREIWTACFDDRSGPIECGSTGFHAEQRTYDDAGRLTESRFLDGDGTPATNLGAALRRYRYDNYDHLYELTSYGPDGEILDVLGSATMRNLYDAKHRLFGLLLLDRTGKPARYTGCYSGVDCPPGKTWHAIRITRRSDGVALYNDFFDHDGQRVSRISCAEGRCF